MDGNNFFESSAQEFPSPSSGADGRKRDYTPEETEFAVFCIENVAIRLGVDAAEVYDAFAKKTSLLDGYVIPCYDVLHTQGKEYVVNDLVDRLREKGIDL